MSKQGGTWYVVADGGKARILEKTGDGMRTRQSFDSSGKGDAAGGAASDTSQLKAPKSDPHEQAKGKFAVQVAALVNEAVRSGAASAVVLAAPASALHDIREALSKEAQGVLQDTLSKDLTNIPDNELASHFG